MSPLEEITWEGQTLAFVVRGGFTPAATTFITPTDLEQQVGFVVYPSGAEIHRHIHRGLNRITSGAAEVILVRRGACEIDVYSPERERVAQCALRAGDLMVMVSGGHGFRMLEDTVLLEIKQGPYIGREEKELF
jgi:uncharacterized protein with PhoU and TrkA domain